MSLALPVAQSGGTAPDVGLPWFNLGTSLLCDLFMTQSPHLQTGEMCLGYYEH
jgi:hypothetical protein